MTLRRSFPNNPKRQQGVALMIVILVFALVAILSVGMYNRQGLFIQKAGSIVAQTQAFEYALASEIYGKRLLKADWDTDKEDSKFVDDLEQVSSSLLIPVEEAVLEAQFNDVQGKLNVNDLVALDGSANAMMVTRFKRLIDRLGLESIKVELLLDWIDDNQEPSNFEGAEDGEYLSADTPYRNGGRPFIHLSELKLLYGLTEEDYEKLLPHITVLPRGQAAVNVNTASAEVLQSLAEGLSDEGAEQLVASRDNEPWESVDKFKAEAALAGLKIDPNYYGVSSNYFALATKITLAERVVRLVSLIYRSPEDGNLRVLLRDQGQKYLITKNKVDIN